ncbi:oxygen-regulated protein 1 isoform X3 [Myripristis murdjan]|uniref:oxygen-regulated protein 1 isoform X3 n=1 Tax=Myripristis murdjan TaxID=586833 RepID=UPI0011763CEA|nr:oxygen-regulated protein 1-like isoform X3 [Myripristis murdjan]
MSNTSLQEPPAQRVSSGSLQTLGSRPLQPISDPSASKRVCFYKSGDNKFSGHRMIINTRTFKTFDALLDALSKKVPLPFGVRTIGTPRGIHLVKGLDDLHDGGSYVCSDQRRVKPLNLDAVRQRQVPWNTTRPVSAGRRGRYRLPFGQFSRRNDVITRPAKVPERVAVRTPKRLVVIKNKDPTIRRTVVLQRRTAPTFDALLDYLSEIMQFPVLKLFSADGRRVDGLAALILCSGVIVAAGNEPFRLGNLNFHLTGQVAQSVYSDTVEPSRLQPQAQKNKSFFSGRSSRNFSLSSERFIVNQINNSRNGSANSHLHHHSESYHREVHQHHTCIDMETCENVKIDNQCYASIVPQDDDIEKSFRVNQDGSMTVEMKVRLTIKEEEMLHWTTTLSRSSLSQRTVCPSKSGSGNTSPDSNNAADRSPTDISEDETKEHNHPTITGKGVGFSEVCEDYSPTALEKPKPRYRHTPTPGPRHVKKKASVESIKMVTESGVQESTLGHYSYMERAADGDATEGHCVVRHSSSSNRPVPKPRKTASAEASNKGSHSSIRSSKVAEVLQIRNKGMEITETVMHIYESQQGYDNYFANTEYSTEGLSLHGSTPMPRSKPTSTDSGPHSSSNDCDIDFTRQPSAADSLHRQIEEILSLSSEPMTPTQEIRNNLLSFTDSNAQIPANSKSQSAYQKIESLKKDKAVEKKKKTIKPTGNQKTSPPTNSSDKKQKEAVASPSKSSKHSSTDKLSNANLKKKSLSSSGSDKIGQRSKGTEKLQTRKQVSDTTSRKERALLPNIENLKKTSSKKQINTNHGAARANGYNVNSPGTEMARPPIRKNISDILQPKRSLLPSKNVITKQKSMTENRISSPKQTLELSESVSMPSLSLSPSDVHQYVENWLNKINPDSVPYIEEAITEGPEPQTKVVFQIGDESESEVKGESQVNTDEYDPLHRDAVRKSASCLSVPLCSEGPTTASLNNEQKAKGLCVSMPSVRVDQENRRRTHKSPEAISPADKESSSSTSNLLSPKAKIKPVLRKLCSSIQGIRRATEPEKTSDLEKSNSLPNFSSQVASVFGSSSKAFLSFLSVMTLRETLVDSVAVDTCDSRSTSEAMLLMESLQKISTIEDEEEQRASLTDLQSRTSSQLRERWKDFQVLRERLESEPISPKFSEQEFALDVVSEGGDAFDDQHLGINELMDELSMPQDLREEISSMFKQSKSFYPEAEESTYVEKERDHSDSEEEVEQFVEHQDNETKQSPEPDATCITETTAETELEGVLDQVQETHHQRKEAGETEIEEKAKPSKDLENNNVPVLELDVSRDKGNEEEEEEKEIADEYEELVEREENEQGRQVEEVEGCRKVVKDTVNEVEEMGEAESEEVDVEEKEQERQEEREVLKGELKGEEKVEEEEEEEEEKGRGEHSVEEKDKNDEWIDEVAEEKSEDESKEVGVEERDGDDKTIENDDDDELDEVENATDKNEEEEVEGCMKEEDEKSEWNDQAAGETDEEGEEHVETKSMEREEWEGDTEGKEGEEEISEEKNEEEMDTATEEKEEVDKVIEGKDEEEDLQHVVKEDEEEECEESVSEDKNEEEVGDTKENSEDEVDEGVSEDKDERDEPEEREEEDGEDDMDKNTEERIVEEEAVEITSDEGEIESHDQGRNVIENKKWDDLQESRKEQEKEVHFLEEEASGEEQEEAEGEEADVHIEAEQKIDLSEEAREEEEEKQANDRCDQLQDQESNDEGNSYIGKSYTDKSDSIASSKVGKRQLEEAYYLQQSSCEEDQASCDKANSNTKPTENNVASSYKSSSEGQCRDDMGNGTDTVNEFKTDDGEEEACEERSSSLTHPVEISQELLDFVNSALQSSSLIFTYDARGNIKIEPDNARVIQTKQVIIPKNTEDRLYGLKRLPSPCTSDLSDYRPETSESGGYKTQGSIDITTESGEDAKTDDGETLSQDCRHSRHTADKSNRGTNVERANSKLSLTSKSEDLQSSRLKSGGSFSSYESGTKASKEDLSYFSAASSLKADTEPVKESSQCIAFPSEIDSNDGVLIEQGRWLLKENHLIRKSPPIAMGMYGNIDSTSTDTGQENSGEDSPPHYVTQYNPLAVISSSELEEMAKPQTPKCTYYNMSHGSDSDPFLDDVSIKSMKKDSISVRGRGLKVSPTIDTSKTWAKKNGSLSSFASVEFKLPDSRVHPQGESSALTARRPPGVGGHVLQAQDSLDTLHGRCGQYCPIL